MNVEHVNTQMSTPINSLPLKTAPDNVSIEDPLIQNVLKEFEDEMNVNVKKTDTFIEEPKPLNKNTPMVQQDADIKAQDIQYDASAYNNKKFIDANIIKKTIMILIIIIFFQKSNVIEFIFAKSPSYLIKYIEGKDFVIYSSIIFMIFYALLYFNLL